MARYYADDGRERGTVVDDLEAPPCKVNGIELKPSPSYSLGRSFLDSTKARRFRLYYIVRKRTFKEEHC